LPQTGRALFFDKLKNQEPDPGRRNPSVSQTGSGTCFKNSELCGEPTADEEWLLNATGCVLGAGAASPVRRLAVRPLARRLTASRKPIRRRSAALSSRVAYVPCRTAVNAHMPVLNTIKAEVRTTRNINKRWDGEQILIPITYK
jgi:hypothetical protein